MAIDENGFLGPDINTWIEKHRSDNAALFDICYEINKLSQTHLFKLDIHSEDIQEVLLALLYTRSLSAYQSSIILIERGLLTEAKIVLRTLLELLFRIGAISKNLDIAKAYVLEDELHRKKFINKFKMLSDSVKEENGSPELEDLLDSIKQNIKGKDIKETQTQWFAQKAGLEDHYNSAYSLFSSSVHANVRDLESLVIADEEGNIRELIYEPDVTKIPLLLFTAGEALILITYDISRVFNLSLEKKLEELHKHLKDEIEQE